MGGDWTTKVEISAIIHAMPISRVVLVAVSLVGSAGFGMIASMLNGQIVDRVNCALPPELRFSPNWWYISKSLRLGKEYRRLFPTGKLLIAERAAAVGMFVCVVLCAWAIGFFQIAVVQKP